MCDNGKSVHSNKPIGKEYITPRGLDDVSWRILQNFYSTPGKVTNNGKL